MHPPKKFILLFTLCIISLFCSLYNLIIIQKHEESSNNNGPVSIADVDNETVVQLADNGVSAIMTRLQSKPSVSLYYYFSYICILA